MSQQGNRLPSFKTPRDLTLLTSATSSLSLVGAVATGSKTINVPSLSTAPTTSLASAPVAPPTATSAIGGTRQKRVFKPNIPPKKTLTAPPQAVPEVAQPLEAGFSRGGGGRGRGARGGRGGRGGRGKPLIQSASVFETGVGEVGLKGSRGSSVPRMKSSNVSIAKLRDMGEGAAAGRLDNVRKKERKRIKEEDDDDDGLSSVLEALGEDVSTFSEYEIQDRAVVLPLSNYLPKLKIRQKTPKFSPEGSYAFDNKPVITDVKRRDFLYVTGRSMKKPILCLFQMPSHLPVFVDQEQKELSNSLGALPEGRIGKIQLFLDGKARFVLENSSSEENCFEIEAGKATGFRQDLASIDLDNKKLIELGSVPYKFVMTPDLETILKM